MSTEIQKFLLQLNKELEPHTKEISLKLKSMDGDRSSEKISGLFSKALFKDNFFETKIDADDLNPIVNVLQLHPATKMGREWLRMEQFVYLAQFIGNESNGKQNSLGLESSAILAVGLRAISSMKDASMHVNLYESLLAIALLADAVSLLLRKEFIDFMPDWQSPLKDKIPLLPFGVGLDCAREIRGGMLGAGKWLYNTTFTALPEVHVSGIRTIIPNEGSCNTPVTLYGSFPPQPRRVFVAFIDQSNETVLSQIRPPYSQSQITTTTPPKVGEGPIGLVILHDEVITNDFTDVFQLSDALGECLGSLRLGQSLAKHVVKKTQFIPRPPLLPGDANLFHGGPILKHVTSPQIRATDPLGITGQNLKRGDRIVVDNKVCPTTYVSDSELTCSITWQQVRGGIRDVHIARGACTSYPLSIRLLPTVTGLSSLRATPGDSIGVNGTCFSENDLTAKINGENAYVEFVTPFLLHVRTFIPRRTPSAPNPNGEDCTLEIFDRGTLLSQFTITLETYRIVTLGDSIMWGQGLLESQKIAEQVLQRINSTAKHKGKNVYCVDRSANSGAAILKNSGGIQDFACGASPSAFDVASAGAAQNLIGEKNCGATSVTVQVEQWAAVPLEVRDRVELVILDGGINDYSVLNLLNIFEPNAWLVNKVVSSCDRMLPLLMTTSPPIPGAPIPPTVMDTFPKATIVVTGYYPLISPETSVFQLIELLIALGHLDRIREILLTWEFIRWRLINRSEVFATAANTTLQSAVTAVNSSRVKFVTPIWNGRNCLFAPDSFVFNLNPIVTLTPEDPVAAGRAIQCGTPCLNFNPGSVNRPNLMCNIASLGHPNALGAQAYADAIARVI